jgi:nucleoside-diphosphate-sugar epimerase
MPSKPPRKRLLLTGGTGSIGPHLIPLLLAAEWEVVLVGRSAPVIQNPHLSWQAVDLLTEPLISDLVQGCDSVLHLANLTKVDPERDRFVARELAKGAVAHGVQDFFYGSSIRVYGSVWGRVDESSPVKPHPQDIYGQNKREIERLIEMTLRGSSTRFRSLRIGHVLSDSNISKAPERLPFHYLLFWGRTYPHYVDVEEATRAIVFLLASRQRLKLDCYNITHEIGRHDTFNSRFASKLPAWQRQMCRIFSLPPIVPYLFWRRFQEASNTRAAMILEKGLQGEGWQFKGGTK